MRTRPFFAARIEERLNRMRNHVLRRLGWREEVVGYAGYGSSEQLRVLARVVLRPEASDIVDIAERFIRRRGWRNFMSAAAVRATAFVQIGTHTIELTTDRGGYIDVRFKNPGLPPGWQTVRISTAEAPPVEVPVQVIGDDVTFGIVSDIDDTILSTALPRPMLAAWNSFVLTEQARQPVPGMARLYQRLLAEQPDAPVVFISTGAWNTYEFLTRFTTRYGFPRGTFLLTDWGPTNTGWFRSGPDHKRTCLRELARDFPHVRWLLVGDDGQHDPELYHEFSTLQPGHVRATAIRELSPAEQVLAHGTLTNLPVEYEWTPDVAPEVRGADGDVLGTKLNKVLSE